jgi:hypothetical protein
MATIPGTQFNITGASGTTGLLGPKGSWRCFVFPRGGYAAQDSTGTTITFDSAVVAARFAVNNWIQAGIQTSNIRQVAAVGGNSILVSGAAVTVTENDRIFLIGSTQPTITGGSATYTIPNTVIRQRDDDAADLYVNSMVTSNSDGLIRFYTSTAAFYDAIIQDGNQANQGYIADLNVGIAEGVNTNIASVFGATVTINGALGVTGWAFFGQSVTMHAALGVTGTGYFGSTLTAGANFGVTGTATFGATATLVGTSGNYNHTGTVKFGNTVTITGALGVTGSIQGDSNTGAMRFNINRSHLVGSTYFTISGWGATASLTVVAGTVDQAGTLSLATGGTTYSALPTITPSPRDGTLIGNGHRGVMICARSSPTVIPVAVLGSPQAWIFGITPTHGEVYTFNYICFGTSTIA